MEKSYTTGVIAKQGCIMLNVIFYEQRSDQVAQN